MFQREVTRITGLYLLGMKQSKPSTKRRFVMRMPLCLLFVILLSAFAESQNVPAAGGSAEKARVFITDSKSWEIAGGGGGSSAGFGGATRGGARPQTAEIVKTFGERCPDVIVNNKQDRADYVVLLDHEGGKGLILHDNKVAVFNKDGDSIVSHSTRSLGNAVKDACEAIVRDWPIQRAHYQANIAAPEPEGGKTTAFAPLGAKSLTELEVVSIPAGADIEIDGNFVGNTPSTVSTSLGQRLVIVKKSGFQGWERKVSVSGGVVRLNAELEPTK
jgi:hypothetical protein